MKLGLQERSLLEAFFQNPNAVLCDVQPGHREKPWELKICPAALAEAHQQLAHSHRNEPSGSGSFRLPEHLCFSCVEKTLPPLSPAWRAELGGNSGFCSEQFRVAGNAMMDS